MADPPLRMSAGPNPDRSSQPDLAASGAMLPDRDGGSHLPQTVGDAAEQREATVSRPPVLRMPSPRGRRFGVLLLIMLAIVAGAGAAVLLFWRPVTVTAVQPHRGPALEAVYATGIVEAIDTARVGSTVPGRINAVAVREGDRVRRGQVLAQLDDRQAEQRLADARARLMLAEQELARDRKLVPTGTRSVQEMQRSAAERDRAEAGVALAERILDEHAVRAPLDGIVMRRDVDPGNTVAANTALFTVASTARLRIAADVDERDIALVHMDAPVAIRADAFPGQAFAARVTNIRRQGDSTTRTFRVEADLPAGTPLLIGMTVDVNVVVAQRDNALLLPPSAVLYDPPQGGERGQAYVFEVVDGRARRVDITPGAVGADAVEIRDGLAPGAQVIADGSRLANGTRVRVAP